MSFSGKILVGLIGGVVAGLFFGELVSPLRLVADGFVKLLQMTVLPYVTVSIIVSLGSLSLDEARRLGLRAGAALGTLWAVAIVFAMLFPLVFPTIETASFFSTSLVEDRPPFDFVGLYIPANPFHSLANNVVPAVVLFSVLLGVALIGIERKTVLLDVLGTVSAAIARATRFVVSLTPCGVFALAAVAAGTLQLEQVGRIQVYLIAYMAISTLLALWVLPGLVAALTPIPYRQVLGPSKDALITAFIAGDLFIVLPILIESCKRVLAAHLHGNEHASALPDVVVPASFNFPHTGKLLSLSFVLFAGWFSGNTVSIAEYPRLGFTGLLTLFGSVNAAIPFLLDLMRIPADTFQLFLATGVINARFGTLVAAVHTVTVALLGSAAIAGAIRLDVRRVVRYAVITIVVTAITLGSLRLVFATWLHQEFKGAEVVYGMSNAIPGVAPATTIALPSEADDSQQSVIDRINARGALRVAVPAARLPYVFRNDRNELVGLDVELAQLLARDLGVKAEFVELDVTAAREAVGSRRVDLALGGIAITPQLAESVVFSSAYLDETLAFVVRDHLRDRFATWASIQQIRDITIAVPDVPYYVRELETRLPGVPMRKFSPTGNPLDVLAQNDAVALPAERGSVMTLLDPRSTVVVPRPGLVRVPIAFPLAPDQGWANLVNTWIELKRRDGTLELLYGHWILGKTSEEKTPRWSIIRDVFHWVE
jgi:Na+/H+-dicarboxylate symporter